MAGTHSKIDRLLERARGLEAVGEDEPAKALYLKLLRVDPTHLAALNELGNLALATGHRSAARTAYRQAVQHHPHHPLARVNLGNLCFLEGELAAARDEYQAALAAKPDLAEAHQGLARTLEELGESAAAAVHWQRGFAGHALVVQRYRGRAPAIEVLLLVSTRLGNVATAQLLDNRTFAVSALYAEFYDPRVPLPPHALVFNAIGDADLCAAALDQAELLLTRSHAPIINPPARVRSTGRLENARRLATLPGVVAPLIREIGRTALPSAVGLEFPLLLRSPGFHTGIHFVRVEHHEHLAAALAGLPGERLLTISYLDARAADGMARKYRVMVVDGALYPLHLAISAHWKVHYFSAAMAQSAAYREEERRFLESMPSVLGPRAMSALERIAAMLGLDYGGIDFGLGADGSVLLFEANATMAILPPPPEAIWDYRRAPTERVLSAIGRMLRARASAASA
jgi:hypothetical protein